MQLCAALIKESVDSLPLRADYLRSRQIGWWVGVPRTAALPDCRYLFYSIGVPSRAGNDCVRPSAAQSPLLSCYWSFFCRSSKSKAQRQKASSLAGSQRQNVVLGQWLSTARVKACVKICSCTSISRRAASPREDQRDHQIKLGEGVNPVWRRNTHTHTHKQPKKKKGTTKRSSVLRYPHPDLGKSL